MFGWMHLAPETWLVFFGAALLFGAGGFAWGRYTGSTAEEIRRLSGALEEQKANAERNQAELSQYRGDVASHFAETSQKLHDLTLQYRGVYDHLAAGAEKLCPESFEKLSGDWKSVRLLESAANTDEKSQPAGEEAAEPLLETDHERA